MTTLKQYSFPLLLLVLIACAPEEKKVDYQEEILIEDSGLFRGYNLGSSPDSVLASENWTPSVSNDSTIEYSEDVYLLGDTVLLDAYLAFDTYGLFEVQVDVFTTNDTLANRILDKFSASLTAPFGAAEKLMTSNRWTSFSESNNIIEITLSQERNDQNQKFISLNYLEPLDDEF